MGIESSTYQREKYIIKNVTTSIISIGDLNVPTIAPGQSVDLLLYTTQQKASQSKNLSSLLKMGWLKLTRRKDTKRKKFSSSDAKDGVVLTKDDQLDNYYTKAQVDALISEEAKEYDLTSASDDYTPDEEDVILVNASAKAVTITMPEAADSEGKFYYIKKIDATANAVILNGYEAETVDGNLTVSITIQYECLQIVCDGTNWWII